MDGRQVLVIDMRLLADITEQRAKLRREASVTYTISCMVRQLTDGQAMN